MRQLSGDASRDELIRSYESDLMLRSMWKTKTARKYFPLSRFSKIVRAKYYFPDGQMVVNKDRRSWSCKICKSFPIQTLGSNKSGQAQPWHRQNCLKHFRSASHCDAVIDKLRNEHSTALNAALEHDREITVFRDEIQQAIIDNAIISCARKSLSLTSVPVVLDVVARALMTCRGKAPVKNKSIIQCKQFDPDAAKTLSRINAAVDVMKTSAGPKVGCRRGRTAITKRMRQLAKMTLSHKAKFLKSCDYLSASCDESDTFSFTSPIAVALQGCSRDFLWGNLFMGQADVAHDKTGEGCYEGFRQICDKADPELFDSIVWLCTDGASAMRSTAFYAGLDGKEDGENFQAYMRRHSRFKKLPNLHGLCHLFDLAIKFALKKCVWADQWLEHVRAVYNWFSNSPSKKSKLKALYNAMKLLGRIVTWRLVYPKYYCPTRWLGIIQALKAILTILDLLLAYVQTLSEQGYRPDWGDPDLPPPQAMAAQVEPVDEWRARRFHEDSFYQWGQESWDLCVTKPPPVDTRVTSEARRLALDEGRAQIWKEMVDGVTGKKSKLLSERIGLTNQMLGLDAIMHDALVPYSILCERIQTAVVPIGHNIRRWVADMFRTLDNLMLRDGAQFGEQFNKWKSRPDVTEGLVKQVQCMGRQFVYQFLMNARHRVQPYWRVLLAMETINPCSPYRVSPDAWLGVKDLCRRVGMDDAFTRTVVRELKLQHVRSAEWSLAEVKECTNNLLKYYHDRLASDLRHNRMSDYPAANKFATLVFSLHVASAIIETFFSKTKYCKNIHRSTLSDDLASATLHLQQLRSFRDDEVLETASALTIDFKKALTQVENSLTDLRKKYVDRRLKKPFHDEEQDRVRDYYGSVVSVDFVATEGCYVFHVQYDSDSDDEDMEHWELREYII